MAIVIGRRPEHGYTRVPNAWLRDPKLSFKAKGLLAYLLSHRDGYQLTVEQIVAGSREGSAAVYAALRELADLGYVRRVQRRGERGKVGEVDYYVADAPDVQYAPDDSASQVSASGLSACGKPQSGDDQQERDVSPGETASQFSACGKSTTKKNRVLEEQEDQSLSHASDQAPAAAADRERDEPTETTPIEHRLITARGVPPGDVEAVRARVVEQCRVRGAGWWVTAAANGTLDAAIAAAVTALSAGAGSGVQHDPGPPCALHPWERDSAQCRPCAGEAKGREPVVVPFRRSTAALRAEQALAVADALDREYGHGRYAGRLEEST